MKSVFGQSKAAIVLENLLSQYPAQRARLTKHYCDYVFALRLLEKLSNVHVEAMLVQMLYAKHKHIAQKYQDYEFCDFYLNVLNAVHKRWNKDFIPRSKFERLELLKKMKKLNEPKEKK